MIKNDTNRNRTETEREHTMNIMNPNAKLTAAQAALIKLGWAGAPEPDQAAAMLKRLPACEWRTTAGEYVTKRERAALRRIANFANKEG